MQVSFFGPSDPIRRHVSAIVNRSMMLPGDWTLKNTRWGNGTMSVRYGVPSALLSAPSGLSAVIDIASVNLNGQQFLCLAGSDGTRIRVWVSPFPQSPARWIEITGTNKWTGPSGNTRFATVSDQVSFAAAKTPRYTVGGTTVYSKDVLVIQNGEDYPRVWDPISTSYSVAITSVSGTGTITISTSPNNTGMATGDCVYISGGDSQVNGWWQITRVNATSFTLDNSSGTGTYSGTGTMYFPQLGVHKPLTIPNSAYSLNAMATFTNYLQIAGSTKAYYAAAGPPKINQANFLCADTTVAPYTGTNVCFKINASASAANGDIATVRWTATHSDLQGEQICWLCQGINNYTDIAAILRSVKIEISPDNVAYNLATTWRTLYDPSASDPVYRDVFIVDQDTTNKRAMVVFNVKALTDSQRDTYQIRFTWTGDAPASAIGVRVLMIASSYAGAFPGTTSWTVTYEDTLGFVESAALPYAPNNQSALISTVGGPTQVLDGSVSAASVNIPLSTSVYYTYALTFKNSDGSSTVTGGLDGLPQSVCVYAKLPTESRAYYLVSFSIYNLGVDASAPPNKIWNKGSGDNWITQTLSVFRFNIYSNRPAPSAFQIPMPIAKTCLFANGRLFAGGIKESTTNIRSDGYFSGDRQPFRFQGQLESPDGTPDENGGLYFQIAGETVKAIKASSASAQGANRIYVWTDFGFYALGRNDPYLGSGFNASILSTATKINERGTNSPRSISQFQGSFFYLDNENQIVRYDGGQGIQVSKYQVDDKTTAIPASRRSQVCGAFFNGRYYMPYTQSGGTTNLGCLVWLNERLAFESDDVPPQNMERITAIYDSSVAGGGQRLLFVNQSGSLYAYEEGTTDSGSNISASFKSRSITALSIQGADIWDTVSVNDGLVSADDMSATLNIDRYYEPNVANTGFRSTIDLNVTSNRSARRSGRTVTYVNGSEPTVTQGAEQVYVDYNGNLVGGKSFYRIEADVILHTNPAFDRG